MNDILQRQKWREAYHSQRRRGIVKRQSPNKQLWNFRLRATKNHWYPLVDIINEYASKSKGGIIDIKQVLQSANLRYDIGRTGRIRIIPYTELWCPLKLKRIKPELTPEQKQERLNKQREYSRIRYWSNVDSERQRQRQKNIRFKSDTIGLIKLRVAQRINTALKNQKARRANKNLKLLGCGYEEYKNYLQSQFVDGMNWDNCDKYGWHIDHIKPLSSFDLSKKRQQYKAFHYTNTKPLWSYDNWSKGYTLTDYNEQQNQQVASVWCKWI
jgi:hypothetical protein